MKAFDPNQKTIFMLIYIFLKITFLTPHFYKQKILKKINKFINQIIYSKYNYSIVYKV